MLSSCYIFYTAYAYVGEWRQRGYMNSSSTRRSPEAKTDGEVAAAAGVRFLCREASDGDVWLSAADDKSNESGRKSADRTTVVIVYQHV